MAVVVFAVLVVWLRKVTGSNLKVFPVVHLSVGVLLSRNSKTACHIYLLGVTGWGQRYIYSGESSCPLEGLLSALYHVQVLGRWLFQ